MFDRRTKNVQIFKDTIELIDKSQRLKDAIRESVKSQKLYLEVDEVTVPEATGRICKTVVSTKRSFEAASAYAKEGKKVCVLNFASATNPGGGVTHGSSAQEECLCRCSTLYPCLDFDDLWQGFYLPHREARDALYNDDCIYTPGVVVAKSDISFPERMPEADWYSVDVITCAAPNLRDMPSNFMNPCAGDVPADIENDDLYKLHKQRIERIFKIAAANGVEILVLGAFGCGAFRNPPEIVSKAFYDVQKKYENYFETIEYAVFCGGHETQNYDAFCEQFGVNKNYDLNRFIEAHERDYQKALAEIRKGHKYSHWMWYIFPQIIGLGLSRTSQFYSISSLDEAKAYLDNESLGSHMIEICEVLLELENNDATDIFGYPDDMKFKSCLTLFELASENNIKIFGLLIDKYFGGERDMKTIQIINELVD